MSRFWMHAIAAIVLGVAAAAPVRAAEDQQDEAGRLVKSVADDGSVVLYRYDEAGRLVDEQRSEEAASDASVAAEPSEE